MIIPLPGRSIKTQLISLLFFLTAVALLVVGFLGASAIMDLGAKTSATASQSMHQRAQQLLRQTADATAAKNSLFFQGIQQLSANTAAYTQSILDPSPAFSSPKWRFSDHVYRFPGGQYGNAATEPASVFIPSTTPITPAIRHQAEQLSYLDYYMPQVLKNEANAVAIYFVGPAGDSRYYPNIDLAKISEPDFNPASAEFYTVGTPQNDPDKTGRWTNIYDDPAGHGLLITATYPVYSSGDEFLGTIGIDVTLGSIAKSIENYSPIESSYAFLVDNTGRAVALPAQGYRDLLGRDPKPNEFGNDLSSLTGDARSVLTDMKQGKQGFRSITANGHSLMVSYAPVEGTKFSLAIAAEQATMLKVVKDLERQTHASLNQVLYQRILPVSLILLVLVWYLGFVYIGLLAEPIRQLTARAAQIGHGHFDAKPITFPVKNEISQLSSAFDHMASDLKASQQKIAEQHHALLHNEQTRLKASINSLNIGFIMTDTNNKTIMLNHAAEQILARAPGSPKPPPKAWTTTQINTRLKSTFAFESTLSEVLKSGQSVEHKAVNFGDAILRIFVAPILEDIHQGAKLGAVILLEDITEAKLIERSKDEFFSIASHELRTPLTAIRGNAALIQQIYTSQIHEQDFNDMVGDIHSASVRLIEIVNDFLDASRLEQGRIIFTNEAFLLQEIMEAVATELATVAKDKGITIKLDPSTATAPPVYADKNRVKQVIYNLVGNAMKFTEQGSVTLGVEVGDRLLKTLVSDTGPGISVENQRLLFRKFQQASNKLLTRESRGTGLGLYISKLLSEQMGGQIALEHSEINKGTTFSFTLPLAGAQSEQEGPKDDKKPHK